MRRWLFALTNLWSYVQFTNSSYMLNLLEFGFYISIFKAYSDVVLYVIKPFDFLQPATSSVTELPLKTQGN